jgi:hypothetical protein
LEGHGESVLSSLFLARTRISGSSLVLSKPSAGLGLREFSHGEEQLISSMGSTWMSAG